ncbi:PRA1 family protein 3-like [Cyprinodon tularosa]|uniref:PRA1 family protein 3-like n=1 Tax=Cyprinodon tularosa TaxID=77115 RepID=UPI0018E24F66|nr:PRA1 family protein 3-like [Cyprinodon tularosa]
MSPLKEWSDFFPGLKGFAFPNNFREFEERLISNLLYYQTNYLVLSTAVFILAGLKDPMGFITGLAVLFAVYLVLVWAGEIQPLLSLKRWRPLAFLITVIVVNYVVIYSFARIRKLAPPTSFILTVITPHVSFRNRGISEVAYMKEATGLGGSAMGILLMTRNKKK